MSIRTSIGNILISTGRSIGRSDSTELAVEVNDHSIHVSMVETDTDARAWDPDLYRRGNMFYSNYANPIKPVIEHNKDLENPDQVDIKEGNVADDIEAADPQAATDGGTAENEKHVDVISSPRYRDYMRQDLVSQLLNPREQWRLIAYGILALGALMFMQMVLTLYATGSF